MFKRLTFYQLMLEISHFKAQRTKISYNILFYSCNTYCSEVKVGVNVGRNALPWAGLEPGLSDSELSALTTRLLDKAVALVCPWYS